MHLSKKSIAITPSNTYKGTLTGAKKYNGKVIGSDAKPSIETMFHLEIYKNRPDINTVVHAHPKCISTYAAANQPIDLSIMPKAIFHIGQIVNIEYYIPGSKELCEAVSKASIESDALLLFNHGMVTMGRSLEEAYYMLETLERCAFIELNATKFGGAKKILNTEVNKLLEQRMNR